MAAKNPDADFKRSRCFELNYVIVLLHRLNPDGHRVQYVDTLQGQSVDWPLGVYLDYSQHKEGVARVNFSALWILSGFCFLLGIGYLLMQSRINCNLITNKSVLSK